MATRTVTGTIKKADGTPWAGAEVRFTLYDNTYRTSPSETYPQYTVVTNADANGLISVPLISGVNMVYDVLTPDRKTFRIAVADGPSATLEALRASYSAAPVAVNDVQNALNALFPGGVAPVAVEKGDAPVVAQASTIDFGAGILVASGPTTEANVSLDFGTGATQAAPGTHTHTLANVPLSALTTSGAAVGDSLYVGTGPTLQYLAVPTFVLGPWQFIDVPNSTTQEGQLLAQTGTAVVGRFTPGRSRFPMPGATRVIGGWLMSNTPISSGQATLQVGVAGTGNAAFSNTVRLDTTNPTNISAVDIAGGISVSSGFGVSAVLVTSATFAPTTHNIQAYLLVRLEI
jgi:hypothetical protein